MSEKFTSGPWQMEYIQDGGYDCMSDSFKVCSAEQIIFEIDLAYYGQEACGEPSVSTLGLAQANAHLLAAAPDMYEALLTAYDELVYAVRGGKRIPLDDVDLDAMGTALAKARGEA